MGIKIFLWIEEESHCLFHFFNELGVGWSSRSQLGGCKLQGRTNVSPGRSAGTDEFHKLKSQKREMKSLVFIEYLSVS